MGSWLYAFAMPEEHQPLDVGRGLRVFERDGFALGDRAARVRVDKEGHCEPSSIRHELPEADGWREAIRLLDSGMDVHVELRDENLIFACTFARGVRNPHVSLGWSLRLFTALPVEQQARYLGVIGQFSEAIKAAAVVILLDAPGYFEDRILVSGEDITIDAVWFGRWPLEIREIWAKGRVDIEGADLQPNVERMGIFDRYCVIGASKLV